MAIKRLPSSGDAPRSTGIPESLVPGGASDSAGFAWEGRTFDHHETAFADDDGAAPEALVAAVAQLRVAAARARGAANAEDHWTAVADAAGAHAEVIRALSTSRVLVPMLAEAGDTGLTPEGRIVEKSQELSIVAVAAPDGRSVLPVFSSVASMRAWNATARPIPVPGPQAAVAAAQEEHDLIVVDPGSSELVYGVRRPAIAALALGETYTPGWADADVARALESSAEGESGVLQIWAAPGDLEGTLGAPEVDIRLKLDSSVDRSAFDALLARLQQHWASDPVIAERVDSMRVNPIFTGAAQP